MKPIAASDTESIRCHRAIWAARPELRAVYQEWFERLLGEVRGLTPVVEIGSGPGFFKEYAPQLISLDILPNPWVDISTDACSLPIRAGSVGALVMVDTLHHLAFPLEFMDEAARVLRQGGRVAMVEPWITPFSYLLYRFLHHEECHLAVDLARPFGGLRKTAFAGNAAIPFALVKYLRARPDTLRLVRAETFVALPYLVTFGFQRSRPMPGALMRLARVMERYTGPVQRLVASRVLVVWEKLPHGPFA